MPYSQQERERLIWAVFVAMKGGKSLTKASEDEGVSEATILRWIDQDETGELTKEYMRARDGLISKHANEILQIADGCDDPAKARVQVEARKWIMSKLMPKRFGERVRNEIAGDPDAPLRTVRELSEAELMAIAAGNGRGDSGA